MRYYILLALSIFAVSSLLAQKEEQQSKELNYFNHTQVSLLVGEESEDQSRKAIIPSFQNVTGIFLSKHIGIGLGVGVEPFEYVVFPVFINGDYFFNFSKTAPYFSVKAGYAFANSHKKLNYAYYYGDYTNKGGFMLNPEIWLRIKMPYFDMTLSGGYRLQHLESRISPEGSQYTYKHKVDYNRATFTLGIMF